MYGGDRFLFNLDEAFVAACQTPLLVLKGNDLYHPAASSLRVAELAPNAQLIEEWKQEPQRSEAMGAMMHFLAEHTPQDA